MVIIFIVMIKTSTLAASANYHCPNTTFQQLFLILFYKLVICFFLNNFMLAWNSIHILYIWSELIVCGMVSFFWWKWSQGAELSVKFEIFILYRNIKQGRNVQGIICFYVYMHKLLKFLRTANRSRFRILCLVVLFILSDNFVVFIFNLCVFFDYYFFVCVCMCVFMYVSLVKTRNLKNHFHWSVLFLICLIDHSHR